MSSGAHRGSDPDCRSRGGLRWTPVLRYCGLGLSADRHETEAFLEIDENDCVLGRYAAVAPRSPSTSLAIF